MKSFSISQFRKALAREFLEKETVMITHMGRHIAIVKPVEASAPGLEEKVDRILEIVSSNAPAETPKKSPNTSLRRCYVPTCKAIAEGKFKIEANEGETRETWLCTGHAQSAYKDPSVTDIRPIKTNEESDPNQEVQTPAV